METLLEKFIVIGNGKVMHFCGAGFSMRGFHLETIWHLIMR